MSRDPVLREGLNVSLSAAPPSIRTPKTNLRTLSLAGFDRNRQKLTGFTGLRLCGGAVVRFGRIGVDAILMPVLAFAWTGPAGMEMPWL